MEGILDKFAAYFIFIKLFSAYFIFLSVGVLALEGGGWGRGCLIGCEEWEWGLGLGKITEYT